MNHPLAALFEQFLKERTYLKNVTPATLVWYQVAFKNYRASIADDAPPLPTKNTLQQFVIRQRERSIRPVTVNTYIGAMKAFCAWLHQEGHVAQRVKQPKLRVRPRVGCSNRGADASAHRLQALVARSPSVRPGASPCHGGTRSSAGLCRDSSQRRTDAFPVSTLATPTNPLEPLPFDRESFAWLVGWHTGAGRCDRNPRLAKSDMQGLAPDILKQDRLRDHITVLGWRRGRYRSRRMSCKGTWTLLFFPDRARLRSCHLSWRESHSPPADRVSTRRVSQCLSSCRRRS